MSSGVSPRLVPSRVISSDEWQASKEAGRVIILGPVSSASATSSVRPGVPSPGSRAVIASSPHPRQASRRRRGGLDDRIPAGIGKREQASKTRTTDGLAPIPIITRSHGLPIPCHIASIAPPPTSKQRDAGTRRKKKQRKTTGGRDEKQRRQERRADNGANDGTKTHEPRKTTSKQMRRQTRRPARRERDAKTRRRRQDERDARRDNDDKKKSKQQRAKRR